MKIALPNLRKKQGPKIFLTRFRDSINNSGLASTCSFLWPFHDVALFSSVARPLYGKPFVIRIDGVYFDSGQVSGSNEILNRKIFASIDRSCGVVLQSEFNRNLVHAFYGELDKPSVVIPNGVDHRVFRPEGSSHRDLLGLKADDILLMTSASWRPHKRLRDIIEIFKKLNYEDDHYHLLILGEVPEAELSEGLRNVHSPGFIDPEDLASWYRTADIYVFLSWLDHCPNTVVEAIVSGLPVVCTNQGGTKELVERASAGIICEVDDEYRFNEVDLYNPPSPDHMVIMQAVKEIAGNIDSYRSSIDRSALSIDIAVERYVSFLKRFIE